MFRRQKNGKKKNIAIGATAGMHICIGKYRQSLMYVIAGIAMKVTDESIVANMLMPATYHGIRLPPLK